MTFTPCRAPLCPELVTRKHKGYCDQHASMRSGWNRNPPAKRAPNVIVAKSSYGHDWRKKRAEALERDGYVCQVCHANGRLTPATEVDHILNKATGGTDDLENLQAICKPCHTSKSWSERIGKGLLMPEGLPPLPNAVIVFGPTGAGKAKWAKDNAPDDAVIVDLYQIIADMTGKPLYVHTDRELRSGIAKRNQLLIELAASHAPCALLLASPKKEHREWWINIIQPRQVITMDTPKSKCIAAIYSDDRRPDGVNQRMVEGIYHYELD